MRLGILASHPIQYQAPWFRALAAEVDLKVYFAHRQSAREQGEAGFGVSFDWDIDLLSGYDYEWLPNVSPAPSVSRYGGCDTPRIRDVIASERLDAFIVSGWGSKAYLQAADACRKHSTPVLIRGDSQLATPRSWMTKIAKKLYFPRFLRRFDGFLVVGKRNAEYLRHYGVNENRMFFVPHFVDNERFAIESDRAKTERQAVRRKWGADEATMVVLFVGKLQPKKRPIDIVFAIAAAGAKANGLEIAVAVFVGDGELRAAVSEAAGRLGVRAIVTGFKNQTELPPFYAAADVLVLPSDGAETWGLVVNEAMASGLPAIVSHSVGCAPDLIEEGRTGFTFPTGDIDAFAGRLIKVHHLKQSNHDFGAALRAKMEQYSVEVASTNTVAAVASCVKDERQTGI